MAKNQKTVNTVILAGAIGLGAYALYKGVNPDAREGEGMLGGSDELYDELPEHEKEGFAKLVDPNTIPEQPTEDPIYPQEPAEPTSQSQTTPTIDPVYTPEDFSKAGSPDTTPQTQPTGLFGTGVTAPQWGLGLLGFTSTPFFNLPKQLAKQGDNIFDLSSAWKRASREAVEETPFVGKKLGEFAFDKTDDVAGTLAKRGLSSTGQTVVEAGAKGTLKSIGTNIAGYGVKAIPFVGIGAGAEFDVWVDDRPRWLAYPTNILGDVVGGALATVTSPLALTGIGATVPVVAGVGGQVATESLIYGAYDTITGNKKLTPEQQRELFIQTKQATNQGTIVDDEFWGNQYDTIISPSSVGGSFNLTGSSKNVSYGSSTLNSSKSSGSSSFFSNVSRSTPAQSVFSSAITKQSTSTGSSKGAVSKIVNIGNSTNKNYTPVKTSSVSNIDTSRFVAQTGGGYSDTVAMQSVSQEVAQQRSNVFSVTSLTSNKKSSRSSSSSRSSYSPSVFTTSNSSAGSSKTSSNQSRVTSSSSKPKPKPKPKKDLVSYVRKKVGFSFY